MTSTNIVSKVFLAGQVRLSERSDTEGLSKDLPRWIPRPYNKDFRQCRVYRCYQSGDIPSRAYVCGQPAEKGLDSHLKRGSLGSQEVLALSTTHGFSLRMQSLSIASSRIGQLMVSAGSCRPHAMPCVLTSRGLPFKTCEFEQTHQNWLAASCAGGKWLNRENDRYCTEASVKRVLELRSVRWERGKCQKTDDSGRQGHGEMERKEEESREGSSLTTNTKNAT